MPASQGVLCLGSRGGATRPGAGGGGGEHNRPSARLPLGVARPTTRQPPPPWLLQRPRVGCWSTGSACVGPGASPPALIRAPPPLNNATPPRPDPMGQAAMATARGCWQRRSPEVPPSGKAHPCACLGVPYVWSPSSSLPPQLPSTSTSLSPPPRTRLSIISLRISLPHTGRKGTAAPTLPSRGGRGEEALSASHLPPRRLRQVPAPRRAPSVHPALRPAWPRRCY